MPLYLARFLQLIWVYTAILLYLSASHLSLSLSVCLSVCRSLCLCLSLSDPSYNSTAWLGIKHQVTSLSFPVAIFHSGLVWCRSVLFCSGRCRIHSLVSFFRLGLFSGLRVFRDSVFSNLQSCFDILNFFFGFVLRAFYLKWFCWYQLFKGLIFLNFLGAFLWVFYAFLLSGSVLSSFCTSTPYIGLLCLLRRHAINSCVGDA